MLFFVLLSSLVSFAFGDTITVQGNIFFFPWPAPSDLTEGVVVFKNEDTGTDVATSLIKTFSYTQGQPLAYEMQFDRPSDNQDTTYSIYSVWHVDRTDTNPQSLVKGDYYTPQEYDLKLVLWTTYTKDITLTQYAMSTSSSPNTPTMGFIVLIIFAVAVGVLVCGCILYFRIKSVVAKPSKKGYTKV